MKREVAKRRAELYSALAEGKIIQVQNPNGGIVMIVMHNKTGNWYQLIDDECKAKINGEWVNAVIYQGKDKETGDMNNFVREKSDFESHFTTVIEDPDWDDIEMAYNISVLKEVAAEYPGKTIENIIAQMEARRKEVVNAN